MAYNDERENNIRLKHFFFPGILYFSIETFLGVIILFLLNLTAIGNNLLDNEADNTNPADFIANELGRLWHLLNQLDIFMQVSLFFLWALAGVLGYMLIFGVFKIILSLIYSADNASKLIKKYSAFGLFFYVASLNDFFKKLLVFLVGIILLIISTLILFSYASSLLKIGISSAFPGNLLPLLASILISVLAIRVLVSAIGLLIPAFRAWYYA